MFVGWGGDCASFGTDSCTLVMDGNRTVEATFAFEGADFQLLVEPGFQTLPAGGSVEYDVKIGAVAGFSAPVSFSVTGLPSGVSAAFSPNPLTPSGILVLTLTAAADAPASTASFTVTATGGGITHEATGSTRLDIPLTPIPPDCSGTVRGVIIDAGTAPIENVQLFVNRPLDRFRPPGDASTDATGAYSLPIQIFHAASRSFNIGAAHFGSDGLLDDYWWASRSLAPSRAARR